MAEKNCANSSRDFRQVARFPTMRLVETVLLGQSNGDVVGVLTLQLRRAFVGQFASRRFCGMLHVGPGFSAFNT